MIPQYKERQIGFFFGAVLGAVFWLVQKGVLTYSRAPFQAIGLSEDFGFEVGALGLLATAIDYLLNKQALPPYLEGFVFGYGSVVGFGDLLLAATGYGIAT